jgi:hypothetical protein
LPIIIAETRIALFLETDLLYNTQRKSRRRSKLPHFSDACSYTISAHAFQAMGHIRTLDVADDMIRFTVCEIGTKATKYSDQRTIGVVLVKCVQNDGPGANIEL